MKQLAYITLIGMLTVSAQAADIYRSKDSEGNVVYSDTAGPGSEKVVVEEPTIVPSQPLPSGRTQSKTEKPGAVKYKSLTITQPADEQTIRNNVANVKVAISAQPHLQSGSGHRLQLLFDGQGVGEPGRKTNFTLESVDRGAHTLQAVISTPEGKVVMRSPITTFFVHKQSVNRAAP